MDVLDAVVYVVMLDVVPTKKLTSNRFPDNPCLISEPFR